MISTQPQSTKEPSAPGRAVFRSVSPCPGGAPGRAPGGAPGGARRLPDAPAIRGHLREMPFRRTCGQTLLRRGFLLVAQLSQPPGTSLLQAHPERHSRVTDADTAPCRSARQAPRNPRHPPPASSPTALHAPRRLLWAHRQVPLSLLQGHLTLLKSSEVALISFQVLFRSWIQMQKNSSKDLSWVKNMGWKSLQVSLAGGKR